MPAVVVSMKKKKERIAGLICPKIRQSCISFFFPSSLCLVLLMSVCTCVRVSAREFLQSSLKESGCVIEGRRKKKEREALDTSWYIKTGRFFFLIG